MQIESCGVAISGSQTRKWYRTSITNLIYIILTCSKLRGNAVGFNNKPQYQNQ